MNPKNQKPNPLSKYYSVNALPGSSRVILQEHVKRKMYGWCNAATTEVSGVGLIRPQGRDFEVYEVFFPKQYCSTGWTELDQNSLSELMVWLHKNKYNLEDLRYWWHTHYNFATFWSGTDENMARRMLKRGRNYWSASTVINQAGHSLTRIDLVDPVAMCIDNVDTLYGGGRRCRRERFHVDIKKNVLPIEQMPNYNRCEMDERPIEQAIKPEVERSGYQNFGHYGNFTPAQDRSHWLEDMYEKYGLNLPTHPGVTPPPAVGAVKKTRCILNGYEVMKALGLSRGGPMIGQAMKAILSEQEKGTILTIGGAYKFLEGWVAENPPSLFTPKPQEESKWVNYGGILITKEERDALIKGEIQEEFEGFDGRH